MQQSAAGLGTLEGIDTSLNFTPKEKETLRSLAAEVAELAARPEEKVKAELWTKHNDLEETKPLVFADPENGWNEIITQESLVCTDPLARVWEMLLKKEIFWGKEMGDDRVIEPFFNVPWSFTDTVWGISEERIGGEDGGSYHWKNPIQDYEEDFGGLRFPEITVDYERSDRILDYADDLLGDYLQVRRKGVWWWTLGMTWDFINLRGLENFMVDMYLNPEWVHKLMAFLRDGTLRKLDFLEEQGLLSDNTGGSYVGSGGFGWTKELPAEGFDPETVRTKDMWGFAESQETVGVSPQMFEEFIFPYQVPILERFGLNCYGCCEPIDKRWDIVKRFPRLRRVSISPWADRKDSAEKLGKDYIISMKPSPTPLAQRVMDQELVRESIRQDIQDTKGGIVEILMKDNHTLGKNPENITNWVRIVKEEIERAY